MESMTSPERVRCVLSGGLPDRVPVLLQNFQNAAALYGISLDDFCRSARNMADAQLAAWERFRHDVLDLENGTAAMAEAVGCEVVYTKDEPPRVVGPAIIDLDQVSELPQVDPCRHGHLPELIEATRLIRKNLRQQACIVGEADQGPFSLASLIYGMENWLVALMDPGMHPQVHQLLEYCTNQILNFCLAQYEAGADFVQIGDSFAGPDVCSPRIYKQFAFPYEWRLVNELNKHGIPLILHICGNATAIIDDMASTGVAMLEIDYKVDGKRCREITRGRCTLIGDLDPSGVMTFATPEEVFQAARRAISTYGREGYFILSPGCTLPANTPAENIDALVNAAKCFGVYGPDGLTDLEVERS